MKRILPLLLAVLPFYSALADCIPSVDGIVQNAQSDSFLENGGLIWVGEPIEEIVDEVNFTRMTRMRVVEVWCGTIIKEPDAGSPAFAINYLNTDDVVHISSPYGTSQDFTIPEGRYVIASKWYGYSYSVSGCVNDMYKIDLTDDSVTGNIYGENSFETILVSQLKTELIGNSSCATGLGIKEVPYEISVFPNPSAGAYNVQFGDTVNRVQVSLYGIDGRFISRRTENSGNFNFDISNLEAGIYMLDLFIDEKYVYRSELVKY